MPVCHENFGKKPSGESPYRPPAGKSAPLKKAPEKSAVEDSKPVCAICGVELIPSEAKFSSTMAQRSDICKKCAIGEIKERRRLELEKLDNQLSRT
jgi:hypothetical protein